MGEFDVTSTAHAVCGSHACQYDFQLFIKQKGVLLQKFLVLLKSLNRQSLLIAVTPVSY
jgi:hypothetical protein